MLDTYHNKSCGRGLLANSAVRSVKITEVVCEDKKERLLVAVLATAAAVILLLLELLLEDDELYEGEEAISLPCDCSHNKCNNFCTKRKDLQKN